MHDLPCQLHVQLSAAAEHRPVGAQPDADGQPPAAHARIHQLQSDTLNGHDERRRAFATVTSGAKPRQAAIRRAVKGDIMLSKWLGGLALAAAVVLSASVSRAGDLTNEQKDQLGKFIHDYVVSHPEIIKEAAEELDRRDKAAETANREKTMAGAEAKLFNSPNQ